MWFSLFPCVVSTEFVPSPRSDKYRVKEALCSPVTTLGAGVMFPVLLLQVISLQAQDTERCPHGEPLGQGSSHVCNCLWLAGEWGSEGAWEGAACDKFSDAARIYLGMEEVAHMPSPRNYPI